MRPVLFHRLLWPYVAFLIAAVALAVIGASVDADARGTRGGTGQSVNRGGGESRAAAAPNRSAGANRGATQNRSAAQNRGAGQNRGAAQNRNANAANRNSSVNRSSSRNTNINNDIDINVDDGWGGGDWDHPVAAGMAVGAAAAVTSAVIGSVVYSVPPSCVTVARNGMDYYQCGSAWYQPQYSGSSVTYVVVDEP